MSIFYRKENFHEKLFLKTLHLRNCNKKLSMVLPPVFSKEEYVETFKDFFPHLWEDIVLFCNLRRYNWKRRMGRGLRTVPYYSPKEFLLKHVQPRTIKATTVSEDERQRIKEQFIKSGSEKLKKRKEKLEKNLVYVQEVCPPYVDELINTYFKLRKQQNLNINARYLILLEASQFKCVKTLSFLYKINACEKNYDLRIMAFYALQRMGEHPWLSRNRKGKKRLSQVKRVDIQKNPTGLIELVTNCQILLYQKFDIFLSHSSRDKKELLTIKSVLNKQGYTVYIDWVNDDEMLKRENQDENTWNVLFLRMDQSYRLLYIMTDNSINSKSTKKEVEYFKLKKKPVYVYQPHDIVLSKPDYLDGCIDLENLEPLSITKIEQFS